MAKLHHILKPTQTILRTTTSLIARTRHRVRIPHTCTRMFNERKLDQDTSAAKLLPEHQRIDARRKKALWRCRQRGWVEIDLLMGNWAAENIPRMDDKELEQLEVIIAQENPNLLNWLLGHDDIPEELNNETMRSMCKYVMDGKKKWTVGGNQ